MSLSTNTTFRVYLEKLGGTDPSQFVGNEGEVFLDPSVPTLKLSDGSTPGGVDFSGGGGGGGGIGTDGSVNTTGIITASSFSGTTASFSGSISVGGTLTYEDVTNVDSIGLITARTGIEVLSGIVTTPKLHVDSVGSGITFAEDLVVQGNARVTGILSIGTSSIVLDSNAKVIRGVEQIRIHSPEQNVKPIIIKQSAEKIVFVKTEEVDGVEVETDQEVSVGIGSTANINTTGIITASSFVGDGSGLTNLPASDVTSVNTQTGAVSLGIEDLDDFLLQATPPVSAYHDAKQSDGDFSAVSSTTGGWAFDGFGYLYVNFQNPTSGTSLNSQGFIDDTTLDLWVSADGVNFTQHTATSTGGNSSAVTFNALSPDLSAYSSATALYFSLTSVAGTPIALADGDMLQYESGTSKFRPVQLGVDDLSDVDTTTVAPTDGQALLWDNTAQKWEPGEVDAVSSVNTQTGAVSLGVEDLDDFEYLADGGAAIPTWTGYWEVHTLTDNQCSPLGKIGPGTDFGVNGANISFTDSNSVDQQSNIQALAGGSLFFNKNGGAWVEATTVNINTSCSPTTMLVDCPDLYTAIKASQVGDVFGISDAAPFTPLPLVDGQALVWNGTINTWQPGGVSGEIEWTLTANGTTDYIFAGPGFAGTETDPAIYVMRGQTYKFTNGMGAHPFQIQSTQGTSGTAYNDGITNNAVSNGTLTWEVRMDAPSTLYYQCTAHADMNGTIYVLDEGGSGGAVSSVNTQTGAVSLGVEDLNDFGLNDAGGTSSVTRTPDTLTWNIGSGGVGYGQLYYGVTYWDYGSEGYNGSNILTYLRDTATFPIDVDINGVTVTINSVRIYPTGNTNNLELTHSNFSNTNNISANVDWVLSLPNTPSEPLANGDILQYVSAESKFKPAQLGVDDLSDVDTSTVAPTDGQALVWDNTAQQWEPGTVSGGGGSSFFVQNATGIHTLSNVGIGTTNATETLTVDGIIGMPFGNVLIGGYNVGSSLQIDVGNYEGTSNVFIGHGQNVGEYAAGQYNTTGGANVFIGPAAGQQNTTGYNNVYIGSYAGQYATTGSDNICMGLFAGNSIDGTGALASRTHNIFMGRRSGESNTTGNNNNFIGSYSGNSTTTGSHNNFFGNDAGRSNTTGDDNIFIGQDAGRSNTTGNHNIFFGNDAGRDHTQGRYSNFFGKEAGRYNTIGNDNNFIGKRSGYYNDDGYYNNFIGSYGGYSNTTGYYNNFIGGWSGFYNTTGTDNNFIGEGSGHYNTTGSHNIFIGSYNGISASASGKIVIGSGEPGNYFDSPDTTSDYQFAVGIRTDSNPSKYWLVGDENFNIGINSTAPTAKLDVIGDVRVGTNNSQGIILTSPNGTQYRLVVANDGTLSTSAV